MSINETPQDIGEAPRALTLVEQERVRQSELFRQMNAALIEDLHRNNASKEPKPEPSVEEQTERGMIIIPDDVKAAVQANKDAQQANWSNRLTSELITGVPDRLKSEQAIDKQSVQRNTILDTPPEIRAELDANRAQAAEQAAFEAALPRDPIGN